MVLRYEHDLPFQFARRTGDAWTLEAHPDPAKWISKSRVSWKYLSDYCAEWGPLSEVLPETPEPPTEDDHLTTGELIAAPLAHRCSGCGGVNTTYQSFSGGREYYCEDCQDVFPYTEGDAPRRVQMLADGRHEELRAEMGGNFHVPVPASQSFPAVPVSSTGGKETGEAAEDGTEALRTLPGSVADAIEFVLVRFIKGPQSRDVVRGILTEAFRASPLPDSETEWGIRPVGQGEVEETGTEEWARAVAARLPTLYVAVSRRPAGPWIEVPRG